MTKNKALVIMKPQDSLPAFKNTLFLQKRSAVTMLGGEAQANKFMLGVYNTVIRSDDLMKCTSQSIVDAAITSAVLQIPIDARQYGWLVPYSNKAQFQLSYKGFIHMAKRDPEVDNVNSQIVYKDDVFSFDLGNNTITHVPKIDSDSYGRVDSIKYVYAVVYFRENTGRRSIFEVMTLNQINNIKSGAKQKSIWDAHFGEMARKTVIKRLCKHAQLGDTAEADLIDNAAENNQLINVSPDGELKVVESPDAEKTNIIIEEYNKCDNHIDLQHILQDNDEFIQDMAQYNVALSKRLEKARRGKWQEIAMNDCLCVFEDCTTAEELNEAKESQNAIIIKLSPKANQNKVEEAYAERLAILRGNELDNQMPEA